jgi:hypothetical protein
VGGQAWSTASGRSLRAGEYVERAVWPVFVVVAAVDAEDVLEVAAAEDEGPVEAVSADRAHPTFGMSVAFGA